MAVRDMSQRKSGSVEAEPGGRFDEALITTLVTGGTIKAAAEAAECSYATARRRVDDPTFRLRLVEAKNDHLGRLLTAVIHGQLVTVRRLIGCVADDSAPAAVWLAAARVLMACDVAKLDGHVSGFDA